MITDDFSVIAGSVTGYRHRQTGRNNQDGYSIRSENGMLAAVICDGCSASAKSEVGAKLVSAFISAELIKQCQEREVTGEGIDLISLKDATLHFIRSLCGVFPSGLAIIDEMFLFTIIGIAINRLRVTIFIIGDGVLIINGRTEIIDQDNAPSYLGYLAYPGSFEVDETNIGFVIRREMPLEDLESLVIASDGAVELINKADHEICILGKNEKIGGPEQFVGAERFARNPTLLQKRLFQLNQERTSVDWRTKEIRKFEGTMSDDTTIVVVKRSPALESYGDQGR